MKDYVVIKTIIKNLLYLILSGENQIHFIEKSWDIDILETWEV